MCESKSKSISTDHLLNTLVKTDKSTTRLLEKFTDKILNVDLKQQFLFTINKASFLKRESFLFFHSVNQPVIYSESIINLYRIKSIQKEKLIAGKITIGRIFRKEEIDKQNITVEKISSKHIQEKLSCNSSEMYCKQYEMFVDKEYIGVIKEFFCDETIKRVVR
jgi:chorismate-pyruvate lyase